MYDKDFTSTKRHYFCESCLAEFVLDIEGYIDPEPPFRFSFSIQSDSEMSIRFHAYSAKQTPYFSLFA